MNQQCKVTLVEARTYTDKLLPAALLTSQFRRGKAVSVTSQRVSTGGAKGDTVNYRRKIFAAKPTKALAVASHPPSRCQSPWRTLPPIGRDRRPVRNPKTFLRTQAIRFPGRRRAFKGPRPGPSPQQPAVTASPAPSGSSTPGPGPPPNAGFPPPPNSAGPPYNGPGPGPFGSPSLPGRRASVCWRPGTDG
ncbi:hypothetical protein JTB14_032934 [Gonioctena quinquepunctata]|nr:hypothetical protein JTB14_032934 [Gonioctena quinquepunctata]